MKLPHILAPLSSDDAANVLINLSLHPKFKESEPISPLLSPPTSPEPQRSALKLPNVQSLGIPPSRELVDLADSEEMKPDRIVTPNLAPLEPPVILACSDKRVLRRVTNTRGHQLRPISRPASVYRGMLSFDQLPHPSSFRPLTPTPNPLKLESPLNPPNSVQKIRTSVRSTRCISCGCRKSPCWRPSWSSSAGRLCNPCGLRYSRARVHCPNTNCSHVPTKSELMPIMTETATYNPTNCIVCHAPYVFE